MRSERCHCGRPLHYTDPGTERMVRALVAELGEELLITIPGKGSWWVPRHFIALHGGLKAAEIERLGFRRAA